MSSNRISSSEMVNNSLQYLQSSMSNLTTIQNQIGTGQKITQASDDPAAYAQIMGLTNETNNDSRYTSNINNAISELGVTNNTLTTLNTIAGQALQYATQAGSSASSVSGSLAAIQAQVSSLITQAVQAGNTTYNGQYIFAGTASSAPPFTQTGQNIAYSGTPSTGAYQRQVEVGQNTKVTMNVAGDAVLGKVATNAGPPVTVDTANSSGLLQTLTQLQLDLQNGDTTAIQSDMTALQTNQTSIQTAQAQMGVVTNQLNTTLSNIQSRDLSENDTISTLGSVDEATAISNLNLDQNIYQASISVLQKIFSTSLVNFLQ